MRLAWIGTGVMGRSMCGHLINAGHDLTVYNRTRDKAEPLMEAGARWADNPAEAARQADVTFTMVGMPEDLRTVVLGTQGLHETVKTNSVFVDFTTSSPSLAVEIAEALSARRVRCLDAPVSGGDVGAKKATLSIMVGGDESAFDEVRPLLDTLGKTIVLQGAAGAGQHTKMVNQILIAAGMVAVCEGLIYARSSGLDPGRVLQSVQGGAAASWSLSNYYPRMLDGDMAPGFYVEHFLKDMRIALEEADRMNLCLPGLAQARQLYVMLRAMGGGKNGTQALIKVLEAMSGRSGPGELEAR